MAGGTPVAQADPGGDPVTQLAPVAYKAIDGHTETLTPWQGRDVSVLVEPGIVRDPVVMTKMVTALDRAWAYYAATTGRLPSAFHSLNGRDEVAEVPGGCGAGCTYIGATGTEMLPSNFESFYQQVASGDLYDQVAFYELGRSFWFWGDQLAFKAPDQDPVVTGFAVLGRFESMAAAGVAGAPYNGTPFTDFAAGVAGLAGQYEADPALTFAGTLAQAKSPGAYGGTDFWASLMMQLAQRHGGQAFLTRFFHLASSLAPATSTAGAVTNWVTAASAAACSDLRPVFYVRWGFPSPDGGVQPRPPAASVPEPQGVCPVPCPDGQSGTPPNCVVPPPTITDKPSITEGAVSFAGRTLSVPLTCSAAVCTGTLMAVAKSPSTVHGKKRAQKQFTAAAAAFTLAPNQTRTIKLVLSSRARTQLAAGKRLRLTLVLTVSGTPPARTHVTLRISQHAHRK